MRSLLLDYFDAYTGLCLQVIPLYPETKIPVGKGWNLTWDRSSAREWFECHPRANMGLLLGEIVDVEGDTPEANTILNDLLGSYPHPFYQSSRSTHHLFRNPDPELRLFKCRGIEFRGHGHQSVLPPSRHEDGQKYFWLKGTKFPVPDMPAVLLNFYLASKPRPSLKPGHMRPWCTVCRQRRYIHAKRFLLEQQAFRMFGYGWQCQTCREVDVRETCRLIRKGRLPCCESSSIKNTKAKKLTSTARDK